MTAPLAIEAAAAGQLARSSLFVHHAALRWLERRPTEEGRTVLVEWTAAGGVVEISPPGARIGSRVHEYGGGAWCPVGERVAFVDAAGVWLAEPGAAPSAEPVLLSPAVPAGEEVRYGDLRATPDARFVVAVTERHRADDGVPERGLVALSVGRPGHALELAQGRHFYAAPRPDRSGGWLAWLCWDHPNMPWDGSELWVGRLRAGAGGLTLEAAECVDGGPEVSIGQPQWLADGRLLYVSDRVGWWQPWQWRPGDPPAARSEEAADFHGPEWSFGTRTMAELADGRLACVRRRAGRDELGFLDPGRGGFEVIDQPCVSVGSLSAHDGGLVWLGATPSEATAPWVWSGGPARPVLGHEHLLDPAQVSVGRPFAVPGPEGRTVHGLLYLPPRGPHPPPLVVSCHGGPTGSADAGFDPWVQLLTGRGIAVAAVDFAGSTGYGRAYRQALEGEWGVADVRDCLEAARQLAEAGRVDGRAMAIRGRSAGGLTALNALAEGDLFAGAVAWYGVTDLLRLVAVTHDFERSYTERLVGPLPESAAEYRRRSPLERVGEMSGSVLLFQGLEDPVVPPSQAVAMAEALRARGVPCRLLTFEGEGHGFRRAETLRACLEAEIAFYQDLFD